MAKRSCSSKAIAFVILTVSAITAVITTIIVYKTKNSKLSPAPHPTPAIRLPKDLIPHSYKIFLQLDFYTRLIEVENDTRPNQTLSFSGNSTVNFHCVQTTKTIFMKSRDLDVFDPSVVMITKNTKGIGVSQIKHHKDSSDFLEIQLNETLETGEDYSLFLAFTGKMSPFLEALYISSYHEGEPASEGEKNKNSERFIAATNLEPAEARRVLPCFDEPDMKAVFNVTIIHRRDTIALSNGGKSGSGIIDDDWQYTSFHPTPKMSTYLFALTVSEFTAVTSPHERVDIKIYARPDATAAGHTQYAANITGKILKFYESYLENDYQQEKLEQIALPALSPGAMENWGLITYQEEALFYEEEVASPLFKKEMIATIIAHELAHQWFGNLVTMKWWNDVWLNEGFATYMSYFAVDHVEPGFKMIERSILGDLHALFEEDALASSHPLSPPEEQIQNNTDIFPLFDTISYSKGAIMLRMLADTVGETIFLKGIKKYLSDFRYNNTDQTDLFNCIQMAVNDDNGHIDVSTMMTTWTNKTGYPIITIDTNSGEIYQKHFLFNDSTESNRSWHVPVRVISPTSESLILLTTETERKSELVSKSGEWILANVNCTGFYRVNYNSENWERLVTQLETNPNRIPLMNRVQLIDDAFNLARAKLVDVTLPLNLTRFLRNEMAHAPWDAAMKNLDYFRVMFDRSELYGPMQLYLQERIRGLYNSLSNYTNNSQVPEDHYLQHIQMRAIKVACSSGLPECLAIASKMFNSWMNTNTNQIHPNLRDVIYCHAVAAGGQKEWDFTWKKMQSSNDTFEKYQLRNALSCTNKVWLLNRYLNYTLNPEKILAKDAALTIYLIAQNPAGHALAWNFIRANWEYFLEKVDVGMVITGLARRFNNQFELDELQRFAKDYNLGSAADAVEEAIEKTQVNIQWVSKHKDIFLEWFERETAL